MWGGSSAYINGQYTFTVLNYWLTRLVVTFDKTTSQGNLAMVIYEWADVKYLGKPTISNTDEELPVRPSFTQITLSLNERNRGPTSAQRVQSVLAIVRLTSRDVLFLICLRARQ